MFSVGKDLAVALGVESRPPTLHTVLCGSVFNAFLSICLVQFLGSRGHRDSDNNLNSYAPEQICVCYTALVYH